MYAWRSRLKTLLIEKLIPGGQVLTTDWVDNYPGFPEGVSGFDLVDKMRQQAERFDLPVVPDEVTGVDFSGPEKVIQGAGQTYRAKTVIIASRGRLIRNWGSPGKLQLTGRGVSYCATCDGPFFRDQEIAVVGGGDTAVQEAVYLTRFAKKVYLIHRRDQLRATRILQEKALTNPKIEPIWKTVVESIEGADQVEAMRIKNTDGSGSRILRCREFLSMWGSNPIPIG